MLTQKQNMDMTNAYPKQVLVRYSLHTQNRQKHGHDQDMTRGQCEALKIESLRLGFTFNKLSLKDSILEAL